MKHLSSEQLSARLDGALSGGEAEAAERHLTECQECRDALADLAAQDAELRPVLGHDPGDAYFEELPSRIAARILTQEMKEPKEAFSFSRLFQSPRSLAWVGTAAVLIVGGGIVLMTAGHVQSPELRDREVLSLSEKDQAAAPTQTPPVDVGMQRTPAQPVPLEGSARAREDKSAAGRVAPSRTKTPANERHVAANQGFARPPAPASSAHPAAPAPSSHAVTKPKDADSRAAATAPAPKRQTATSSPPAASTKKTQAQGGRATEVALNQAGEPVPVPARKSPPPPAQTAAKEKQEQVRKQTAATPLQESQPRDESAKLGAPANQPILKPIAPAPSSPPAAKSAPATSSLDAVAPHDSRLCGVVQDPDGRPVAGASVDITLLRVGTTTDLHGEFCIDVPPGEHRVTVMAVGFGSTTQTMRAGEKANLTLTTVGVFNKPLAPALAPSAPPATIAAPSPSRSDPYVALPESQRSVVRAAQHAQASADVQTNAKTAAKLYDDAANGWQKALKTLMGQPLELETRWRMAESRYRAWEKDPNSHRETAAVDALTAFAGRAPGGPQRDQATRMLDHIKH